MFSFTAFLERLVEVGNLTLIDAKGNTHHFGDGTGPAVTIRVKSPAVYRRILLNPSMGLGESYMDGLVDIEQGTIREFLDIAVFNYARMESSGRTRRMPSWLRSALNFVLQHNPRHRARRNVAHHYDLSSRLYELFLDSDRQYSCAYFASPDDSLEEAQLAKKRHIAAKLLLEPGQKLLDIGCGWGGLGLYCAQVSGASVTGVTLSEEQHKIACARAKEQGLDGKVDFRLIDYRDVNDRFDRIVSVGMFEHVGTKHYDEFFNKVRDLLAEDGVMLLHTIGRSDGPGVTDPWIRKYIFPGGYIPALSEMMPAIERSGLVVTDIEVLRLHYAETLRHWSERFSANRDAVKEIYDERFCRMWEFYLAGAEMAFRHWGQVVFQVQLARKQDAVPLTRSYLERWENDIQSAEPRLMVEERQTSNVA